MIKDILKSSFWQLFVVYVIAVTLVYLNIIPDYSVQFVYFALVIASFGYFALEKREDTKKIAWYLYLIPFLIIITSRVIPYLHNSVPLGYDPGLYKFIFESYAHHKPLEQWVISGFPPGLAIIVLPFYWLGFSSNFILIHLLILFDLFLGVCIYLATSEWFSKRSAFFAVLIYAISFTQFLTFWFNYYKNIVGLCLLLLAFYSYRHRFKKKYLSPLLFVFFGSLLGGTHRPTFLIFGLTFFIYTLAGFILTKDLKKLRYNILIGILIIIGSSLFYIGHFNTAILPGAKGVIKANIGSGTFIDFNTYRYYALPYLPFGLLGVLYLIKKKDFTNFFLIWFIVNIFIVGFSLIFYNRFIIHLDIVMIILAGLSFNILISTKKKLAIALLLLLVGSGVYFVVSSSIKAKPLINQNELDEIKAINNYVKPDDYVMSTDRFYSPWLKGYVNAKIIAPGLFDEKSWDKQGWIIFWSSTNMSLINNMVSSLPQPLYIFLGKRSRFNKQKFFNNSCYEQITPQLVRFVC